MQKKPILVSLQSSLKEENTNFYGKFYLGPFEIGQGLTLANALRRTLLSELNTFAITSIEIDGVTHEYSVLRGVRESVLDILLNMKKIVLKKGGSDSFFLKNKSQEMDSSLYVPSFCQKRGGFLEDRPFLTFQILNKYKFFSSTNHSLKNSFKTKWQNLLKEKSIEKGSIKRSFDLIKGREVKNNIKKVCRAYLQVEGPGIIRAKHILFPSFLQCVDPEQYIATLSEDGILNIKMQIREGKNFVVHNLKKSVEDRKSLSTPKRGQTPGLSLYLHENGGKGRGPGATPLDALHFLGGGYPPHTPPEKHFSSFKFNQSNVMDQNKSVEKQPVQKVDPEVFLNLENQDSNERSSPLSSSIATPLLYRREKGSSGDGETRVGDTVGGQGVKGGDKAPPWYMLSSAKSLKKSSFYFGAFDKFKIKGPFISHLSSLKKKHTPESPLFPHLTPNSSFFQKYSSLFRELQKEDGGATQLKNKGGVGGGATPIPLYSRFLYDEYCNRKRIFFWAQKKKKSDAFSIKAPENVFHKVDLPESNRQLKLTPRVFFLFEKVKEKNDFLGFNIMSKKNFALPKKKEVKFNFKSLSGYLNLNKLVEKNIGVPRGDALFTVEHDPRDTNKPFGYQKRFWPQKYLSQLNLLVHQKPEVSKINSDLDNKPNTFYNTIDQHNKIRQLKKKPSSRVHNSSISTHYKNDLLDQSKKGREPLKSAPLFLDPVFMPVNKVNYLLELDERLHPSPKEMVVLEIWTNGSIMPNKALKKALNQLIRLCLTFKKAKMLSIKGI